MGVLITPWVHGTVPLHSVALGLALRQRGHDVSFIVCPHPQAREFDREHELRESAILRRLVPDLASCAGCVDVIPARRSSGPIPPELDLIAQAQLIWDSRARDLPRRASSEVSVRARALLPLYEALRGHLARLGVSALYMPGGFWGASGPALAAAESLGVRVATLDFGPASILFSGTGIAAQHADVAVAMAQLERADPAELARTVAWGRAEMQRRTQGSDDFQPVPTNTPLEASSHQNTTKQVLIPLNIEWDAAALRTHTLYDCATDWLADTVRFILTETDARVIVRQHPHERLEEFSSPLDWAGALAPWLANPRLEFIRAEQKVNSYDLVRSTSLVLPKVSTFGIECAALGIPVIVEARSYYAGLPFVQRAGSREEYHQLIREALMSRGGRLSESQRESAWRCFYLTQACGFIKTQFNPLQEFFTSWVHQDPNAVFSLPEVDDMCRSVASGEPYHWLVHRRRVASGET
ncbi:MAG: hypothetical protein AB2A00_00215 [Myxococcota bacterium]